MIEFIPVISEKEIKKQVKKTGALISQDYRDKKLVLAGILKGAFVFLADLTRNITIEHEIDMIGISSYSGTSTTGKIQFTKKPDLDMRGKDILIVEDIVDTGRTLFALTEYLKSLCPASIKICSLIDKHERRELELKVDYSCFRLESGFIVGYGLDYNQKYRNLPAIFDLKL